MTRRNLVKRVAGLLGPGLIAAVADDDPSSIGTCAVAGASLGFGTLWWILIHWPLTTAVQLVAARVGLSSGRGLTSALAQRFPKRLVYALVVAVAASNVFTLGADLGAIADSLRLVTGLRGSLAIVPVAGLVLALQVLGSYRLITTIFKWLALALLAYAVNAVLVRPDLGAMLRATFVPHLSLDREYVKTVAAVVGTFLSPFVLFWQSDEEVEEKRQAGRRSVVARRGVSRAERRDSTIDVVVGMAFSSAISYVIVVSTAMTLYAHGQRHIESGAQAAAALKPLAGDAAGLLFAAGMIGAGLLAVPVLSGSTAFMLAQLRGWREGLNEKWWRARPFYGTIAVATLAGVAMNYVGIRPMDALVWSSVLCSVVMPPLLFMTIRVAGDRRIMSGQPVGVVPMALAWASFALLTACVLALVGVTVLLPG